MPFIVCDRPDPEQMVEYYTIAGLPGDPESPLSASIEYGVKYDISDVPPSIPTNIRLVF